MRCRPLALLPLFRYSSPCRRFRHHGTSIQKPAGFAHSPSFLPLCLAFPCISGTGASSLRGKFCLWFCCVRLGSRGSMRFMPCLAIPFTSSLSMIERQALYSRGLVRRKQAGFIKRCALLKRKQTPPPASGSLHGWDARHNGQCGFAPPHSQNGRYIKNTGDIPRQFR